ncbi:unnamed protein product [Lupinus luteus]|uniref:Uncharacterized protein n=1 Tax=Lupinus luteus TaxID=3873 RepID=A0AAV1XGC6_LUPLU
MAVEENSGPEVPPLPNPHGNHDADVQSLKKDITKEVKKQLWLGGPLVSVSLLQYSLQMISIMFVGHLGNLPLSGASLGMGSALETLCGQAYGAGQYRMLGIHTQRAMLVLLGSSIPLSLIWFYSSNLLILMGQDHEIAAQAGIFNRWMIPGLFAYAILQCFNRFLQSQNNVFPLLISSGVTTLVHVVLCWFFVIQQKFGSKGAALAISISYWINVFILVIYINLTKACAETWNGISKEALNDIISFIKLASASAE